MINHKRLHAPLSAALYPLFRPDRHVGKAKATNVPSHIDNEFISTPTHYTYVRNFIPLILRYPEGMHTREESRPIPQSQSKETDSHLNLT